MSLYWDGFVATIGAVCRVLCLPALVLGQEQRGSQGALVAGTAAFCHGEDAHAGAMG